MIAYNEVNFYPIPNIEKYYISKCGKVLSTKRKNPIILKSTIAPNGYEIIKMYYNKKHNFKTVHRLVAKTFLPDFDEELQVDHIDNNKLNNDLSNLRMVTGSDNERNVLSAEGYTYEKNKNFIRAHWYEECGKQKRKGFSVNLYGFAFAFLLVTNIREEMVDKYYNRV